MSVEPCSSTAREVRSGAVVVLLIEVVRNTRSPHTTGLECARPGIGVDHATFFDAARSHDTGGVAVAAATPDEPTPRNDGHCCADTAVIVDTVSPANMVSARTKASLLLIVSFPPDLHRTQARAVHDV